MIPNRCKSEKCGLLTINDYCKDHKCLICDDNKINYSLYCDMHSCHNFGCNGHIITLGNSVDLNEICNNILNEGLSNLTYFVDCEEFIVVSRFIKNSDSISKASKKELIILLKDIRKMYLNMLDISCLSCIGKQIKFILKTT